MDKPPSSIICPNDETNEHDAMSNAPRPDTPERAENAESDSFLLDLGERVRTARARRGMTRKILSRDSGVSERYLAQLENGQGNISIVLLRQVARAMGVEIADLVREGPDWPAELNFIVERLRRLDHDDLDEAHRLISSSFGTAASRPGKIALIGLRGAGKSTLGQILASSFSIDFLELAVEIERDAGMSANEIFSLSGQTGYRRHERRALEAVLARDQKVVLSTGGGLVVEAANYELLLTSCFTVWLKASPEEHMNRVIAQGDHRPMADNDEAMDDLRRILEGRDAMYRKADAVIDTTGRAVDDCLAELVAVCRAAHPGLFDAPAG